ncbi:hypothetical protein GH714_003054 [Hevea brasiliensis]|uniref:Protein kinase domain-containing protein n=1 Tax=Hevea brasiliensis TaxID=3981 RepID=A0A6A6LE80_HEVBR|nr:hypothetical protein GH714_003054 [Hevea brasiliensis]
MNGEYVASGSDDGRCFIWEKQTGRLIKMLNGDEAVVNCVQCHPFDCVVATSDLDSDCFHPSIVAGGSTGPETSNVLEAMESNQRRLNHNHEVFLYCSNLYPKAESYQVCNWCLSHETKEKSQNSSNSSSSNKNSSKDDSSKNSQNKNKGESTIATCDPYNWDCKSRKKKTNRNKPNKPIKIRDFTYPELLKATNGFSAESFLGKGSHGTVYKASLDDGKLIAAVKKTYRNPSISIHSNCTTCTTPAENEIEILSRVQHPRLVNLIGFCVDSKDRKLLVVEYMPNGSLYDLLHCSSRPPSWTRRIRFALQIAKAVQALHLANTPVIHRDKIVKCVDRRELESEAWRFRARLERTRGGCTSQVHAAGRDFRLEEARGLAEESRPFEAAIDSNEEVVNANKATSRVGSRRNRKVSSVSSVEFGNETIGWVGERVIRSKSIGSFGDTKLDGSESRRNASVAVKIPLVKLSKSRSTGVLHRSIKSREIEASISELLIRLDEKVRERDAREATGDLHLKKLVGFVLS